MRSQGIDKADWKSFTDQFTRMHEGWTASLEFRGPGEPARVEVDESPFRGARLEQGDALVLTFGEEPEEHFAHVIRAPRVLRTSEADDHSEASLIIESSDGSRCTLALWA